MHHLQLRPIPIPSSVELHMVGYLYDGGEAKICLDMSALICVVGCCARALHEDRVSRLCSPMWLPPPAGRCVKRLCTVVISCSRSCDLLYIVAGTKTRISTFLEMEPYRLLSIIDRYVSHSATG